LFALYAPLHTSIRE